MYIKRIIILIICILSVQVVPEDFEQKTHTFDQLTDNFWKDT